MQNKFISYDEVEKKMNGIEEIGNTLSQRLNNIERDVVYMFIQIKECQNAQESAVWFECLNRIQSGLALLAYTYDIGIPERLHRFMSDFDNFEEAQEHYFRKIQKGEYTF